MGARRKAPELITAPDQAYAPDLQSKARTLEACVLALDMIRTGAWHFRDRYDDEPAAEALRCFADFVAFHLEDLAIEVRFECERWVEGLDGGRGGTDGSTR